MNLYHATPIANLARIQSEGLRAFSYWTNDVDLKDYYIETIEDEGTKAAVLVTDLDALLKTVRSKAMEPDHPGLEEPITTVLGLKEKDIHSAWASSGKTWRDCLEIVHSLRCRDSVPAQALGVLEPLGGNVVSLSQYLERLGGRRSGLRPCRPPR